MSTPKPRRRLVAALLTTLTPGLGHLYSGEHRRALGIYVVWFGLVGIVLGTSLLESFPIFVGSSILFLALYVTIISSAVLLASEREAIALRAYNRWYVYGCIVLLHAIVMPSILVKISSVQTYYVPGGSMKPTILAGDRMLASKVTQGEYRPARGEVVAFIREDGGAQSTVVCRVIGLPGETIRIEDKKVYLDGQQLEDPWGAHQDSRTFPNRRYLERKARLVDNFDPLKIPQGSVFLLGDNRGASFDSRFNGPVELSSVVGRALYVYWSAIDRSLLNVRLGRIGTDLREATDPSGAQ